MIRIEFEQEPQLRRVVARYLSAKADYQEYVERKQREHEKPLGKDDWEARVHGGGGGSVKDEAKLDKSDSKGWGEKLRGLSEKAKTFLKDAPKTVQSFVHEPETRKRVLSDAKATLRSLPEKVYSKVQHAIKHEVEEFKEAAIGVKAVLSGNKMTDAQKKAVKAVAFDAAITVAVAAVSGGLAAGTKGLALKAADTFTHSLAKKVALNAVTHGLGKVVTFEELGHFGHGIKHVIEHAHHVTAKEESDDRDLMVAYVTKLVHDELGALTPETLTSALEGIEND
jgi:hypothetical protein